MNNHLRIVAINLGNFGSTGTIMANVAKLAREHGHEVVLAYPETNKNRPQEKGDIIICNSLARRINEKIAYMTGYRGCHAWITTRLFIQKLKKIQPDIIQLHNLHNNYLSLRLLFRYIKKHHIRVVWTLHDCWAFTGQCPHFVVANCEKWKTGCHNCPQLNMYPRSKRDRSKQMWKLKKKWFTGVQDMTIVTPSHWLKDLVKQSFLREYPVQVIHNGIDLSIFCPTPGNFRSKYGIPENKKILLGVSFGWGERKGLDVFIELARRLDPAKYQIVLVGTDDKVDQALPASILSIHRTQDQKELAEIYTAADLFVNPTREEVLGLVNVEANACGTPVLTFRTGGSPECIDKTSGHVVDCDDIDALEAKILRMCEDCSYNQDTCINRAKAFNMSDRFQEYVDLYEKTK